MLLPLSLKILGAVLLAVFISFFVLKKKKFLWPVLVLVVGLTIWQVIVQFNRANEDLTNVKADVKISAIALIKEFETGDSSTVSKKYNNEIIEVTGNIKELKKEDTINYTIMLGDSSSQSSVQCEIDSIHWQNAFLLTKSSSIKIRGHFVGYQKEKMLDIPLGSDIKLNRCVIVQRQN